jgi:hypothetical protein
MKLTEITEMIESFGLPCTYLQWEEGDAPALPYVAFYYPISRGEYADDKNYMQISQLNIELYTKSKNVDLENQIIQTLEQYSIPFESSETYLEDEKMYEVLFECEILIEEEDE